MASGGTLSTVTLLWFSEILRCSVGLSQGETLLSPVKQRERSRETHCFSGNYKVLKMRKTHLCLHATKNPTMTSTASRKETALARHPFVGRKSFSLLVKTGSRGQGKSR